MRAVVVVVLAVARIAAAEPPGVAPLAQPAQPKPTWSDDAREPEIGTLLAVAGVAMPLAVVAAYSHTNADAKDAAYAFAATAIVTPAIGHWYGGEIGGIGIGIRAVGALCLVTTIHTQPSDGDPQSGGLWAGLGLIAAGAIYDIATSGDSVRRWNAARGITPDVVKLDHGVGVGVAGRF